MVESNVWNETPLWSLGKTGVKKNTGMKEDNLLSLSYGNIVRKNINSQNGLIPDSYETYQIVSKNDIIFRFTDLQNDKKSLRSAIVKERGIITSAYTKLTPNNKVFPNFLSYSMRSKDHNKEFYKMGSGVRQSLNWEEFSQMRIPLPPLETQHRIADYLDRETAQIDDNVSNLNAYVELLKQRRQVLITDAVTGRIDSNGNRVESNFPTVKGCFLISKKKNIVGEDWANYERLSLTMKGVVPRSAISDGGNNPESLSTYQIIEENDLVFKLIDLENYSTSRVGLSKDNGIVSSAYIVSKANENVANTRFLYWFYMSLYYRRIFNHFGNGVRQSMTFDDLSSFSIPLPPLDEQKRIADFLDRETAEIDALIEDSTQLRDLLLKRRQVLITEVVTGKKEV